MFKVRHVVGALKKERLMSTRGGAVTPGAVLGQENRLPEGMQVAWCTGAERNQRLGWEDRVKSQVGRTGRRAELKGFGG